jgi:replicative DNA helicase
MCAELALPPLPLETERVPPHDTEAERSVLGAMLIDERAVAVAVDALREQAFYTPAHRLTFGAIRVLFERREPCDIVTVASLLQSRNELEKAGGAAYVAGLASAVPTSANIEHYAKIVSDKFLLRELIRAAHQIAAECHHSDLTAQELIEQAEQRVFKVAEITRRGDFDQLKKMMLGVIEHIEALNTKGSAVTGLDTGFTKLNDMTTGLHGGELIIVAARPAMGKTAFALSITEHVAIQQNRAVAIFSLEMTARQVALRMLGAHARVEGQRLRRGDLRQQDWAALIQAGTSLSKTDIYIDSSPQLTPLEVNARCRRLKAENPNLALVLIDYIQLMDARSRAIESRQQEIAYISRSLKAMAIELDLPVIAISQLNRESERGKEKSSRRPQLSQLRESGAIEQDADLVLLLYRPAYYTQDVKFADYAEVIIAKQRNGPTGTVVLQFLDRFARFDNPPEGFEDAYKPEL